MDASKLRCFRNELVIFFVKATARIDFHKGWWRVQDQKDGLPFASWSYLVWITCHSLVFDVKREAIPKIIRKFQLEPRRQTQLALSPDL